MVLVSERPSEPVPSFCMRFGKVMNPLRALGHDVSDLEVMGRFQTGVLQSSRDNYHVYKLTKHRLDKMDLNK